MVVYVVLVLLMDLLRKVPVKPETSRNFRYDRWEGQGSSPVQPLLERLPQDGTLSSRDRFGPNPSARSPPRGGISGFDRLMV